jgi:site-specific DNA-methyltransferase (adenine-specific)
LATLADISAVTITAVENGAPGVRLAVVEAMATALGLALRLRPIGETEDFWDGAGISATHEGWTTPTDLLERLYPLVNGRFDLDPCSPVRDGRAAPVRAKNYYTLEQDGLELPWTGSVYMNPPFKSAASWVAKAKAEAQSGRVSTLIGLLPARVDTTWWHDHVAQVADIWFLKGRLKFGGADNSAPFPCAVVAWAVNDDIRQGLCEALPTAWWVGSNNSARTP